MVARWECARDAGIPFVCVVDIDRYHCRPLIKTYIEAGFGYLFSSQVINFSTTYRKSAYSMIATAVDEAVEQTRLSQVEKAGASTTASNAVTAAAEPPTKTESIHHTNMSTDAIDALLRQLVIRQYESVGDFFDAAKGKGGVIGRQDWKRAVKMLGLNVEDTARKVVSHEVVICLREFSTDIYYPYIIIFTHTHTCRSFASEFLKELRPSLSSSYRHLLVVQARVIINNSHLPLLKLACV